MTNKEIYHLAKALNEIFNDEEQYYPAFVNYYIQKNKITLLRAATAIEETLLKVYSQYGTLDNDGIYRFSLENQQLVNQEIHTLMDIENEIDIASIKLSMLASLNFTSKQMQALLFMIEED